LVYILQILRKDHSVRFAASAEDIGSDVDLAAGCHCYANVAIRTDAIGGAGQSK
jgi:acetyltransferase-like isoleucine patch superfamily enzyme